MPDLSLDLRYLRYALAVAENTSFRKAAVSLGVVQSTLSRRIKLLEHRIGFPLFERSHVGVRLTAAGETFLKEATTGVGHLERAVQLATASHRGERGELSIGILASLSSGYLNCLLQQLRRKHDGIRTTVHEGTASDMIKKLTHGILDIAFVTGEPSIPGYRTVPLWTERVLLALPSTHPLCHKDRVFWDEVRNETFVVSSGGPGPEIQDFIIQHLAKVGFRPTIEIHEVSRESLLNLVGIGYGITLTSTSAEGLEAKGIVFRPLVGGAEVLPSSVIWSPSNKNTALKRFLAIAERVAKQNGCRSTWPQSATGADYEASTSRANAP
jgi:DNA-binding transcriptional LysR family regulator